MPADKPTVPFHERYGSDAEFKRQVDEARKRAQQTRSTKQLTDALAMPHKKAKLY